MIKRLTRGAIIAIAAVMLLLPFYKAQAGIPVGTWRSHPAYNNATYALNAFGKIFVISEGALYFYDPADHIAIQKKPLYWPIQTVILTFYMKMRPFIISLT